MTMMDDDDDDNNDGRYGGRDVHHQVRKGRQHDSRTTHNKQQNRSPLVRVGGRGCFEEEVEDGCGRLTDEAAAALSKRRRSRKRDKATTNNEDNHQYTTIKQKTVEVGGRRRRWPRNGSP